jgi:hypothetical protein
MATFDRVSQFALEVDSYELAALERPVSSGFVRHTTVVTLRGGGEEGVGEDVTYEAAEHELLRAGPMHPLPGSYTLASFSESLEAIDLFPDGAPDVPVRRNYRRWAFESAALDLALRQARLSLAQALDRAVAPVHFVVSRRLPEPPTVEPLRRILAAFPGARFKLDPTSAWSQELVAELASLQAVDVLDLKAAYRGTPVDQPPDARLYTRVAEAFPDALIEDPDLVEPATAEALAPYHDRISWDAIVHSVADIEALPFPPRALNFKPSRFGSIRALFDGYDYCADASIRLYGGGQFELGCGRGQIQYLASLFHPDGPNDVAPLGYDGDVPDPDTLASPLLPAPAALGFRWA